MSGCCSECENKSQYTYIRYASDINGSNLSVNKNSGGIERCYMAIITSDVLLDVTSIEFPNYFINKWFNICEDGEDSCCCVKFGFKTPTTIQNTWNFDGAAISYLNDTNFTNAIKFDNIPDGEIFQIPNLKDNNSNPLETDKNYYLKFDYDFSGLNDGDVVTISLGDGAGATKIVLPKNSANTTKKVLLFAQDGSNFDATSLIFEVSTTGADSGLGIISNFEFGSEKCYQKTSDFVNDGDDGVNPFVTFADLYPSGNAIIKGGVIHITGLTYYVWASEYIINGVYYNEMVSGLVTLDTAPANPNKRFDLFVVNNDGVNPATVGFVKGDEEVSPNKPDIDYDTQSEVSFKLLDSDETTPGDISTITIWNENLGIGGGEWDVDNSPAGADFDYATGPYDGIKCIRVPALSSDYIRFLGGNTFVNGQGNLVFALKTNTQFAGNTRIIVRTGSTTDNGSSAINFNRNSLLGVGFDHTNLGVWQLVQIPLSNYSQHYTNIDYVDIQFLNTPELFIDFVKAQNGLQNPGDNNTTTTEGLITSGYRTGGEFTDQGSGVARFASGTGYIYVKGSQTLIPISWPQTDLDLSATDDVYFIYVNSSGVIQSTTTEFTHNDYRTRIPLRRISIRGGVISGTTSIVSPVEHYAGEFWDIWRAYGNPKLGLVLSQGSTSAKIQHSVGEVYGKGINMFLDPENPNEISLALTNPITYRLVKQDGVQTADTEDLDFANYDNGGTITAISGAGTRAQIFTVYLFPGENDLNYRVFYGQTIYTNVQEARQDLNSGLYNPTIPNGYMNAYRLGWVIMSKDGTVFEYITSNRFGDIGGAIASADTGALLAINNLGDLNDVPTALNNLGIEDSPIPNTYADLAALVAGQGNQRAKYIYEVTDGSGFTGITSGKLWVKYLGTTNGNESDYSWEPRSSGSGGTLDIKATITDAATILTNTQKGEWNLYDFTLDTAQTIQINNGVYVKNDIINVKRGGQGSLEIFGGTNVRISGVRDINNRYFVNDPNSIVSIICLGNDGTNDLFMVVGNLTRGYTGAITTSSYSSLVDGAGAQNITVIGTGFSNNMPDPILTGNATLNSWVYVNKNQITLNITETGAVNDTITVTYWNGDEFIDTDAITIIADLGFDPADLRHYYRLESDANDYKSTLHGTNTNVVFSGTEGDFNGTDAYIDLPDDDSLSYGDGTAPDQEMSISFMVNFDTIQGDEWLINKYSAAAVGEYRFSLSSTTNMKNQFRTVSQAGTYTSDYDISAWTTGTWYHMVITKTTGKVVKLYVNGSEVSTTNTDVSYVAMDNLAQSLRIGAISYQNSNQLDGKMKRVGFWNKVLDAAEVAAVYAEEVTNNNNLI